jgi:plasmid stabilization system protein ParE
MKLEFRDSFVDKLTQQVAYIAEDKPSAARKFKAKLIQSIKLLAHHPYKSRRSIYFEDDQIRDFIFQGYTIVYKIDEKKQLVSVFALITHEGNIGGILPSE